MSEVLLRARSGMETAPIVYNDVTAAYGGSELLRGIVTEYDRTFWYAFFSIGTYVSTVQIKYQIISGADYTQPLTQETLYIDSSLDNKGIDGFLIDDNYYYFTSSGVGQIIMLPRNDVYSPIISIYDENNAFDASGQMKWYDDHTVCCVSGNGFVLFDIETKEFTYKQASVQFSIRDFCVTDNYILATSTEQTSTQLLVYNKQSDTFSTIALTHNDSAVLSYYEGKYYIAQNGYLTTLNSNLTVNTPVSMPWTNPRTINVSGDCIMVTCYSSSTIYFYDMHAKKHVQYSTRITMPSTSSTGIFTSASYCKMFRIPHKNGSIKINFKGYSRFQIGQLYQQDTVTAYEQETISNPFIKHDNYSPFITLTDGTMTKELTEEGTVTGVKKASMHRGVDYNIIKSMEIINNSVNPNVITATLVGSGEVSTYDNFADLKTFLSNQYVGSVDVIVGANVSTSELRAGYFYNTNALHSIVFYAPFETFYSSMFYYCGYLEEIVLPEGMLYVDPTPLNGTLVERVVLPNSVTTLRSGAFASNGSLKYLISGTGLTTIQQSAFANSSALISVEIGPNIQSIDSSAFPGCSNLQTITIHASEGSVEGAPWGAPNNPQIIWDP